MPDGAIAVGFPVAPLRAAIRWRSMRRAVRSLRSRPATLAGMLILLSVVSAALFAHLAAPRDPNDQDLLARLLPPMTNPNYPLGSDHLGRDMLSRIIFGSRASLLIAFSSVLIAGSLGTALGLIGGYLRGWPDEVIGWLTDVQLAVPFILLAIAVVAAIGSGVRNLILVFGITSWVLYARIIRAETLVLREREFVEAARTLGAGQLRIVLRHLLPNLAAPLIVLTTFDLARLIILEASMSFLGLGVEPATPSWGGMLADGRNYLSNAWWVATLPGLAVTFTVLGINLIGDWLRDWFDPRWQL